MSRDKTQHIVQETADGSHTLFIPSLNEHYHSVNGAIQETEFVFIDRALRCSGKTEINVFEVGFGTGLNALLTARYALDNNIIINYTGIEFFPLDFALVQKLNYAKGEELNLYHQLHTVEWESRMKINNQFYLTKIEADLTNVDFSNLTNQFDIIYFDAFSPDIQKEMWTKEVLESMYQITKEGGILTTYCAKGQVRRDLKAVGFSVERLAGPPGKREMLRATKA